MACFDVYEIKRTVSRYVVDVQADVLASLATRVVVPLLPVSRTTNRFRDLNPLVSIGTEALVFFPQLILTTFKKELRQQIFQVITERDDLTRALDMLLCGF
jgi:toxin CcdB